MATFKIAARGNAAGVTRLHRKVDEEFKQRVKVYVTGDESARGCAGSFRKSICCRRCNGTRRVFPHESEQVFPIRQNYFEEVDRDKSEAQAAQLTTFASETDIRLRATTRNFNKTLEDRAQTFHARTQ